MTDQARLVMCLKVRDEADVIETNLRYHAAQGVDFFIVTDNGSVDGTLDTLRRWEHAGRLRLIEAPGQQMSEEGQRWVTEMARLAAVDHGADWVLHNDADMFWWPLQGSIREAFARISASYGVVVAPTVDFVGRPDGPGSFAERLTVRESHTPVPPTLAHRGLADIVVTSDGAHAVDLEAAWLGQQAYSSGRVVTRLLRRLEGPSAPPDDPLVPAPIFPIRILHFPLRSQAQFEQRLRVAMDGGVSAAGTARALRERCEREGIQTMYATLVLDDAQIAAGIRTGELVRDTRLRDFLAQIDKGGIAATPELAAAELEAEIAAVELDAHAGSARQRRAVDYRLRQAQERTRELDRRLQRKRRALRRARSRWPPARRWAQRLRRR